MQGKACPKDCRKCGFHQHAFCAAQMAYTTLKLVQELSGRVGALEKTLEDIVVSTGELIDPAAQTGSGAD